MLAVSIRPMKITFFDKLFDVIRRYNMQTKDIWNIDENGVTGVQKRERVVARRGYKQV